MRDSLNFLPYRSGGKIDKQKNEANCRTAVGVKQVRAFFYMCVYVRSRTYSYVYARPRRD